MLTAQVLLNVNGTALLDVHGSLGFLFNAWLCFVPNFYFLPFQDGDPQNSPDSPPHQICQDEVEPSLTYPLPMSSLIFLSFPLSDVNSGSN